MTVTLTVKKVPISSTRSKTGDVRAGPSSTRGVPCDTGPLPEHPEARGAEENTERYTEGVRLSAEVPGLTWANLRHLEGKDPVAAALASIVSSMPRSETTPTPGVEVANAKIKAWRRATMKGKWKDAAWERCSELLGARRGPRYLRAKCTGRRPPNRQSGNPPGCLKNLRIPRNRRNMNA